MERKTVGLKLTVLLRIHSRTQFFRSAFESILGQTYDASMLEIIILTNLTEVSEYFSNFNNLNLAIYNYKDSTEGEVLWEGISRSSGEVICFLDDDDLWKEERLQTVHHLFMEHKGVGYYHNSVEPFNDLSNNVERKQYEVVRGKRNLYVKNSEKWRLIRRITGYYPDFNMSSICIRRDIISKRLGQLRKMKSSPDTFIYFCALESECDFFLDSTQLTFYRHHGLNLTKNNTVNEDWNEVIVTSHAFLVDAFAGINEQIKNLAQRRLALTKIQVSLRSKVPSKKQALHYSVEYLRIFFSFLIPIDAFVLFLLILSILDHNFAQKIYFKYV